MMRSILSPFCALLLFGLGATAVSSPAAAQVSLEPSTKRDGDAYMTRSFGRAGEHRCRMMCQRDADCLSFNYERESGSCDLNRDAPPLEADACCVSGVREGHGEPPDPSPEPEPMPEPEPDPETTPEPGPAPAPSPSPGGIPGAEGAIAPLIPLQPSGDLEAAARILRARDDAPEIIQCNSQDYAMKCWAHAAMFSPDLNGPDRVLEFSYSYGRLDNDEDDLDPFYWHGADEEHRMPSGPKQYPLQACFHYYMSIHCLRGGEQPDIMAGGDTDYFVFNDEDVSEGLSPGEAIKNPTCLMPRSYYGGSGWSRYEGRVYCLATTTRGQVRVLSFMMHRDYHEEGVFYFTPGWRWRLMARDNFADERPECVRTKQGGVECAVVDTSGTLRITTLVTKGGLAIQDSADERSWRSIGGDEVRGVPSCVAVTKDRTDCFVRGADDRLKRTTRNKEGIWSILRDLGGELSSSPNCLVLQTRRGGDGDVHCFARGGETDSLKQTWFHGDDWVGRWNDLGGRLTSVPECYSNQKGRIDCFARLGEVNRLMHVYFDEDWPGGWIWKTHEYPGG